MKYVTLISTAQKWQDAILRLPVPSMQWGTLRTASGPSSLGPSSIQHLLASGNILSCLTSATWMRIAQWQRKLLYFIVTVPNGERWQLSKPLLVCGDCKMPSMCVLPWMNVCRFSTSPFKGKEFITRSGWATELPATTYFRQKGWSVLPNRLVNS